LGASSPREAAILMSKANATALHALNGVVGGKRTRTRTRTRTNGGKRTRTRTNGGKRTRTNGGKRTRTRTNGGKRTRTNGGKRTRIRTNGGKRTGTGRKIKRVRFGAYTGGAPVSGSSSGSSAMPSSGIIINSGPQDLIPNVLGANSTMSTRALIATGGANMLQAKANGAFDHVELQ